MTSFKRYLAAKVVKLSAAELGDVASQLSNWSYLHLSFMEAEPTQTELEVMMYVELTGRNRAQILRRLYSRWQKAQRNQHYKELGL